MTTVFDLRYTLRIIRRDPGYALTAMLCLALGIGINSSVFSFLDSLYLRRLPVPDSGRIAAVERAGSAPCSWREYLEFRGGLRAFSGLAAVATRGTFMDLERANFAVVVEAVSGNFGETRAVKPARGRWFTPQDETAEGDPPIVIAAPIWERYFGRDSQVIGRRLRLEKQWYRIAAVAPPEFRGVSPPRNVDAWIPLPSFPIFHDLLVGDLRTPGPDVSLVGRLAFGENLARARAEMQLVDACLQRELPRRTRDVAPMAVSIFVGVRSTGALRTMRPLMGLLLAVVAIVLLIACVNVANLLLSRATVRRREMALRQSLGASKARLIRQGLTEGMVLALGGTLLGLLFGYWTDLGISSWLAGALTQSAFGGTLLEVNWRVALFTALVAIFCALLFSLSPALESASLDLASALKIDGRSAGGPVSRKRDFYVIAQVALSTVLLIGAGLLVRALTHASRIEPGFATDHRLYVRLFAPEPDFTPEAGTRLFTRLLEQARALPGVRDATLSFAVLGFTDGECAGTDRTSPPAHLNLNVVEPNYFDMMQVPLLRGRNFRASDRPQSPRVVIVNETMAKRWWPAADPIGKVLWFGCDEHKPRVPAEVIGVARDSKYVALEEERRPFFYLSRQQVWWNGFFALIAHTEGDLAAVTGPLLQLARSGGPNLRVYELRSLEEVVAMSLWRAKWQAALLGAFGLLAMILSALGLYGVVAYTVAQRTHEIGIRMALGALRGDVLRMVLSRGLRLTTAGVLVGLVLSAAVTRFLRGFLYGVSPLDPAAFAGACLGWFVIATLASYLPARRATHVDPLVALREE